MQLEDWSSALAAELGVDVQVPIRELLDVARVAAHSVDRPAAPLTTFLIGLAAAGHGATPEAIAEASATAKRLAQGWAAANDEAAPDPSGGDPR